MVWMLLAAVLGQSGVASPLAQAEQSASNGRFDLVLSQVEKALSEPLADADRRRAWELKAIAASAFDNEDTAVDAFRHLLGLNPDQAPLKAWSPKLVSLFSRAKQLGPIPAPPKPPPNAADLDRPEVEKAAPEPPAREEPPRASLKPASRPPQLRPLAPPALEQPSPPAKEPGFSWNAWQAGGLAAGVSGTIAIAAGIGFGATSQSDRSRLLGLQRDGSGNVMNMTRQEALALDSQRLSFATAANVLWVAGAVLLATGAGLLWKGNGGGGDQSEPGR